MRYFNSRDARHRAPFGAVPAGMPVFLRVLLPRFYASRVQLRVRQDGVKDTYYDMFWAGATVEYGDGEAGTPADGAAVNSAPSDAAAAAPAAVPGGETCEWWDCHYCLDRPGLCWYDFVLSTGQWLTRLPDGTAALAARPGAMWQLTAYDPAFATPDWLAGGVMYQIFPDRFARGAIASSMIFSSPPPPGIPAGRVLRDDWGGTPTYAPDEHGVVRNNDYFGGDLRGIAQRLDYLKKMGVTCLYLNPIFEAHTSHRYDTADYTEIDPLLGTEADFAALCKAARQCGIRVLLDGVFSHTGADSVYFNKNGRYDSLGAYQSTASPYAPWYQFQAWPDSYAAWWGFPTLPEVNEMEPSYLDFITGEGGVARRWLAAGASGWRLDVADELPDAFIETLRKAVKAEKPDALLLGEVWEDASDKISYGERRRYLLGGELDSVMNYPFRTAMLRFVRGEGGARELHNAVLDIAEHYPPPVLRLLMNPLSTHDTPRALTALAGADATGKDKNWQAATHLSDEARARGTRLLKLAGALQYCLPGVPCLYYGDEAGLEGYADPFNRGCYPWGKEDTELMDWFCKLGALRLALRGNAGDVLREGDYVPLETDGRTVGGGDGGGNDIAVFIRIGASDSTPGGAPGGPQGGRLLCAVNRSDGERTITLPYEWENATPSLGGGFIRGRALTLPPLECAIVVL